MATRESLLAQSELDLSEELHGYRAEFNRVRSVVPQPPQVVFNYAWCLIHCPERMRVKEGIRLISDLLSREKKPKSEYLYYIAFGYFRMGEYVSARRAVSQLLTEFPTHTEGQVLMMVCEERISKDSLVGAAIVGGVVASLVGLGMMLLKK